jgi:tRNA(fMet)-specific endonuclease VapC
MESALLDTDTLSEIMKGINLHVQDHARRYLALFRHFTFSIITRYEILRGLKARRATRQIARFEQRSQQSEVLPLSG